MQFHYRFTPHTPPRANLAKKTVDKWRTMKMTFSEKKNSTVAFIYIKREAAHQVILCNNTDLCPKNDFETHTLQAAITHHRLL